MEDSYENRALFLVMWCGAPEAELRAMFPKWYHERNKLKVHSVEETLWVADFCKTALALKNRIQGP